MKFYPYKMGGGKSFSHAEGGHKFWGSFFFFFLHSNEVLAILKGGGSKKFPLFCRPLPVINDQSLNNLNKANLERYA